MNKNFRQVELNQAVTRDPAFFEAYCQLADTHELLYSAGNDHTAERLFGGSRASSGDRLRPMPRNTSGTGELFYLGPRDYAGALAELETAQRRLPRSTPLRIDRLHPRRRGQPEEGLHNLEKALERDPRNYFIMQQIAQLPATASLSRGGCHSDRA
jgi:hypothetical protein